MLQIRRSQDRGHAQHGWLDSRHTFSFAGYYNPNAMGFRTLRVLNDDHVEPGMGFGKHPHRDMEIITYVTQGALKHKDTLGNGSIIKPGEVQLMSAGSGIQHSEMNASATEPVKFLQMWIIPSSQGGAAGYQQEAFAPRKGATLLVSPTGRDGSLSVKSDVDLYRIELPKGESTTQSLRHSGGWLHLVRGELTIDGERLAPGDGVAISAQDAVTLTANTTVEALLYDLPEGH